MDKKISIIVPAYNSEKTIKRCINSILHQTYRNFELVVVDDGSNDKTPQLLDDYALLDERIKVIHKANGGVSSARNVGLENATGEYITFCDADDLLLEYALENYIKSFGSNKSVDAVFSKYISMESSKEPSHDVCSIVSRHNIIDKINAVKIAYSYNEKYYVTIWNKAFKRSLIFRNGDYLHFSDFSWGEDELWLMQLLDVASVVDCIDSTNYVWVQENNSLTRGGGTSGLYDVYCVKKEILNLYRNNQELRNILALEQFRNIFNIAVKAYLNDDEELLQQMMNAIYEFRRIDIFRMTRLLEIVKKMVIISLIKMRFSKAFIKKLNAS